MPSIWKDLLFLQGHLVHREDLDWQPEPAAPAEPAPRKKPGRIRRTIVMCCSHAWPRIMSPR